jgi:hypothetical protein
MSRMFLDLSERVTRTRDLVIRIICITKDQNFSLAVWNVTNQCYFIRGICCYCWMPNGYPIVSQSPLAR